MTERNLRILLVAPWLPYPPSWGSATRTFQLARLLARRHEVTMVCSANGQTEEVAATFGRELTALHTTPTSPEIGTAAKRSAQVRSLFSRSPFLVATELHNELQATIDELVATQEFDSINLETLPTFGLRFPSGIPIVLDEHNIEYEVLERMANTERSLARRAFSRVEFGKLRRYELRAWHEVDGCAITSEREADVVRSFAPETPTTAVPNGVDVEFFTPAEAAPEPDSLVFTGLLRYRPNVDAVHYLVNDIFPLVRRERPDCTLTIVGGGEEELLHLAGPGIHFTGFVPDLRPYIARASVALAPIRMGSGTRLKVVEALAMAKAMVSTTIGCEGIDVRDGEHLMIADSAAEFADAVVKLLDDPDRARRLGENGAALARAKYSWARSTDALEALHLQLVDRATGHRGH